MLIDTIFYLVITVIQIAAELADVILLSPDLRAAEKDLKEFIDKVAQMNRVAPVFRKH